MTMGSKRRIVLGVVFFIIIAAAGHKGVKIRKVDLPVAIHNGTGPVDLSCFYQVDEQEKGLVVKWFHDSEQIYQWIPPMTPQDIGIISGLTEYPTEIIKNPFSRSVIRLKRVTVDMTGDYTCSVSTFSEDATSAKHMTVYVPDNDLQIYASTFNSTHVNITCVARGARPRPSLSIIVDDKEVEESIRIENYRDSWIRQEAILPLFTDVNIVQCEINIPGTGYKKREKFVYYPKFYLTSKGVLGHHLDFLILLMCLLIIS